jgi:hydroxymethylpyrimidine/phosphomethylpyrimidine kinase
MTFGCRAVLLKGGHGSGREAVDVLFDGATHHVFSRPRVDTRNTHGTGCTLSAAIAAGLASGQPLEEAVAAAKAFVSDALASGASRNIGSGNGPVDHHFALRPPPGAGR